MDDKIVMVTGASRGIGLETAKTLKHLSSKLLLTATSTESFDPVRAGLGKNVSFHGLDLSSVPEIESFCKEIKSKTERLDVLINNCGIYLEKPLEESEITEIEKQIEVNLRAPILLTKGLLPLLKKGKDPIIINISSVSAALAPGNQAAYSAAKSGISAFSSSIRKELNPKGIRVTVIYPYSVNTWNDPEPQKLLRTQDMAELIKFVLETDPNTQIDEVTISALGKIE